MYGFEIRRVYFMAPPYGWHVTNNNVASSERGYYLRGIFVCIEKKGAGEPFDKSNNDLRTYRRITG